MSILEVLNIAALIIIPIAAVLIGQYLQTRAEKRKDKMAIFQCLMTHRAIGWSSPETVNALNSIDIVFVNDKNVRTCWASLLSKYHPEYSVQEKSIAQCKLLEAMAVRNKITWDTIQNPYYPQGLDNLMKNSEIFQQGQLAIAKFATEFSGDPSQIVDMIIETGSQKQEENHAHP